MRILLVGLALLFSINATVTDTGTGSIDDLTSSSEETTVTTEEATTESNDLPAGMLTADDLLPQTDESAIEPFIEKKGAEVVRYCQIAGIFFSIVCFIVGGVITLIGAIGSNSKMLRGGAIAILLSATIFTAIWFAPQILQAFSSWLSS